MARTAALWLCIGLLSALIPFTIGCSANATADNSVETLYQRAHEASSPQHGKEDLYEGIRLLSLALEKDPNYLPALDYRATLFISVGLIGQAIGDLERLVDLTRRPEVAFSLCMAKEQLAGAGGRLEECYLEVADAYRESLGNKAYLDLRFLMALKMAGAEEFPGALQRALAEVGPAGDLWGPKQFHLEVLEMDRSTILHELHGYPR